MGIPEIQKIVSSLAREYGAQRIYLFGPYARGEETAQSDIDLRMIKVKSEELNWVACCWIWRRRWVCQ